jgi:hypothetical protein
MIFSENRYPLFGIATRYDKLAANFLSAVALAAIVVFWV